MKKTTFAFSVSFLFHVRVLSGEEDKSKVRQSWGRRKVRKGEGEEEGRNEGNKGRKGRRIGDVEAGKNQREDMQNTLKK